ncbi:MAG TPA: methionine--tRNA ligase subunit beta, partial [Ignavibacteriaceae bacterium]|nr:methionine--tRNA ligase subunit beta [Ignavibacteriaceae bacterium]
ILGNFINRTFTFVFKNFDGKVPTLGKLDKIDEEMLKSISDYPQKVSELFEKYKIRDGVNEIMNLAREGNKYSSDSEPWKTIKSNKEKCSTTLNVCLQAIYTLAELFSPVLPFSTEKVFKMLNSKSVNWNESGKPQLKDGHQLNQPEILFPKIEDEMIEAQINKLPKDESEKEKIDLITYNDFMKVQLRTAEVIEAEKVPKSDKLLKLKVKLENEERQVIAGIAKNYEPENLIGKKVVIVANLQPAKLMGLESKGMILAVETSTGSLEVLKVPESVSNGTRVK